MSFGIILMDTIMVTKSAYIFMIASLASKHAIIDLGAN